MGVVVTQFPARIDVPAPNAAYAMRGARWDVKLGVDLNVGVETSAIPFVGDAELDAVAGVKAVATAGASVEFQFLRLAAGDPRCWSQPAGLTSFVSKYIPPHHSGRLKEATDALLNDKLPAFSIRKDLFNKVSGGHAPATAYRRTLALVRRVIPLSQPEMVKLLTDVAAEIGDPRDPLKTKRAAAKTAARAFLASNGAAGKVTALVGTTTFDQYLTFLESPEAARLKLTAARDYAATLQHCRAVQARMDIAGPRLAALCEAWLRLRGLALPTPRPTDLIGWSAAITRVTVPTAGPAVTGLATLIPQLDSTLQSFSRLLTFRNQVLARGQSLSAAADPTCPSRLEMFGWSPAIGAGVSAEAKVVGRGGSASAKVSKVWKRSSYRLQCRRPVTRSCSPRSCASPIPSSNMASRPSSTSRG